MPLTRIRYRRRDDLIDVGSRGTFDAARDAAVVLPLDILRDGSLNDLRRALEDWQQTAHHTSVFFTEAPWEEYDPHTAPRSEPEVLLPHCELDRIEVSAVMYSENGTEPPEDEMRRLLTPVLNRYRADWVGTWSDDDHGPGLVVGVIASMGVRRRRVGELFDLGQALSDLLGAYSGAGELTARSVFDLVRGGRAPLLVGQREGTWLDVKEVPYPLRSDPQKFELAKDVAAFANTGRDALIVLGLRGRTDRNGDVVAVPRPFHLNEMNVEGTRAVLRDRIVPTILDVEVGVVESHAGYGYGYIFLPAQPPETLPYLVAGALVGGAVAGVHVSIPYRAGEDTAFADAARVHSMLLAGRVALGGGSGTVPSPIPPVNAG